MVTAYSMFDNGGKRIIPTFIDRIQDRYGRTVYKHDQRECRGCDADKWKDQAEPSLVDRREQVIDPMTAYQITSIMEGVVQRGTATVVRSVGKPIAGKTGTTNDEKDVWFIGYSPDIVVGVYMGYDKPKHIARGATGGHMAAPIVADFLKVALADKPAVPFRVPAGIKLIRVDAKTGMRAGPGDTKVILEAFKPGTGAARQLFGDRLRPIRRNSRRASRAKTRATSCRRPTPIGPCAAATASTNLIGPATPAGPLRLTGQVWAYSITSSARASSDGGTVRPNALAVLRLMTSSYLVGAWADRSAGFSPLRMRST